MLHLFLSTLAMMGLTFLIGFFVAAIIKGIALAADSMDFYSSHLLELQRLRKIKKARARFIQSERKTGRWLLPWCQSWSIPIKSDRLLLSGHKDDLP